MKTLKDSRILDLLSKKYINYFSLTLFKKGKPIISHCNHPKWLQYYWKHYGLVSSPPGQDYLVNSKLKILFWEDLDLDKPTRDYIQTRSKVVGVNANVTLLFPKHEYLTALTLATNQGRDHLMGFLNTDLETLVLLQQTLVYEEMTA